MSAARSLEIRAPRRRAGAASTRLMAGPPIAPIVRDDYVSPASFGIRTWQAVQAADLDGGACGDRALTLLLDSGRTAAVLLDIAGHGPKRAELSSAVAEVIVSSLVSDPSPAVALGCADRTLRTSDAEFPYALAFLAIVHPVLRTVVYASAGQDCAFVLGRDKHIRSLPPTAPMLGIPLTLNPCDALFYLEPTETLIIATDGISESRPPGSVAFFGVAGVAGAVAGSLRSGDDPALGVLEGARVHAGGKLADDAAVVVISLTPVTGKGRLPAEPRSATTLRKIAPKMTSF